METVQYWIMISVNTAEDLLCLGSKCLTIGPYQHCHKNLVMVLDFFNLITVDISLGTVINQFQFIKLLS